MKFQSLEEIVGGVVQGSGTCRKICCIYQVAALISVEV